jgi:prevent-host-death family protein
MTLVPVRDLRNHTSDIVRRLQHGEDITITANGTPIATLVTPRKEKKRTLSRAELVEILRSPVDLTLRGDLAVLLDDSTDDLGPIR